MNRRSFLQAGAAFGVRAAARRPNIIFILADDLGYGDLGCYGGPYPTPRLDRLAAEGVRFTSFYAAAPICSPSRVGFLTGQFPARHRIHSFLNDRESNRRRGMRDFLDPAAPSVARAFRQAGYATAHFGKWHMGGGRDVGDAPLPRAYGFDESLVSFEGLGDRILPPGRLSDLSEKLGHGDITRVPKHEQTAIYVDRTIDFIRGRREKPFYVHLWLNDVHDPFAPRQDLLRKYENVSPNKYERQFYAVIEEMDRQLGRLFDALDELGVAGDTMVVFTGDNGPTAWPYYYKEGLEPPGRTGGLRGRKWSLYEGGIREPFLVRWKGKVPAARVNRETVLSAVDLFPSFCRVAGIPAPPVAFDGQDLSAALLGRGAHRTRPLFWEYPRSSLDLLPGSESDRSPRLAVRDRNWKLLMNPDGASVELYDVSASPKETGNLAARRPDIAKRLSAKLLAWRKSMPD